MPSTLRFLRQFLRPNEDAVVREETTYRRGDETLPASLYRPAEPRDALPGWVALHGLTWSGREHTSLDGFARALAASGTAVLVPDIPEWRALRVAPGAAVATVEAAVLELAGRSLTAAGRVGVIGFSFGGTHALRAATTPSLEGHLAAVASWGGYADVHRTLRFAFTGRHEHDGETHTLDPDPYGRWIFAGNYLTGVPGYREAGELADALLWLAREVGRQSLWAWEPTTDPLKEEVRAGLSASHRELFDRIAPPAEATATAGELDRLDALAGDLAHAALTMEPELDPSEPLHRMPVPVFLAHGRDDRLVPWTELPRLRQGLPDGRVRHAMITGLFAHSGQESWRPSPSTVVEAVRLVRGLSRLVRLV